MCPPLWGDTWGYIWSKLQIQERWWVGCMSPKLKNDWEMPMFRCVCISVSDQSPSTKRCNKQDMRNQVVQFLTNPFFLANFQNGHSPPLHIGMERLVATPKRGPHAPPLWGAHGVIHGQKLQIQERWWVGCKSPKLKNDWLVPMF